VNVTLITLSKEEIEAMLQRAAMLAVAQVAKNSGELLTLQQVADHLHVCPKTVSNRVRRGQLPKPVDGRWRKHEVMAVSG
jgi:uncharacterized protein YdbL (DUF1318 family)